MYAQLSTATLKNGARMEIGVVECPDPSWAGQVGPLLSHKGPPWSMHVEAALQEPLDALETRFYLGLVDGRAITSVMIVGSRVGTDETEQGAVGILGHVYTRPEQRQQGAYSQLMAVQMEHTRALGYRILTLGTGFETHPYWIYHRFGFRSVDGTSGRMRWLVAPGAQAEYFRPGTTTVRPMRWDDWAALNLVALQPTELDEELPRSWAFGLRKGHGSVERSFLDLRAAQPLQSPHTLEETGQALGAGASIAAMTLVTEHGAAAGWAILQPDDLALGDGWRLDFHVHPAFREHAPRLLATVPWPAGGRVAAYSSGPDGYRAATLQESGFRRVADLPGWVQRGAAHESLHIFFRTA